MAYTKLITQIIYFEIDILKFINLYFNDNNFILMFSQIKVVLKIGEI